MRSHFDETAGVNGAGHDTTYGVHQILQMTRQFFGGIYGSGVPNGIGGS